MSCGEVEYGRCDVCGKESVLSRKVYYYPVKCECHSPCHFEIVMYCKDCTPKEPMESKVTFKTDRLKRWKECYHVP